MRAKLSLLVSATLALLLSSALARRCGPMAQLVCTDTQCNENCVLKAVEPQACGTTYLDQVVNYGAVGASCDYFKMTLQFFVNENCQGDQNREAKTFYYDQCTMTDTGSVKYTLDGEQPPFYELSEAEYEARFNQRWKTNAFFNVLGYGPKNMYVPPLFKPKWLLSEIDRYFLTVESLPIMMFLNEAFLTGIGNFDAWNGYWYNNAQASGSQLYPEGLNKYYDLYSLSGITNYFIYWFWYWTCTLFTPFTILPVNMWLGILNGLSLDDVWKVIVPPPLAWFFHVRGENGWVLS